MHMLTLTVQECNDNDNVVTDIIEKLMQSLTTTKHNITQQWALRQVYIQCFLSPASGSIIQYGSFKSTRLLQIAIQNLLLPCLLASD